MAVNDGRGKDDIEELNFIQSFYQMKQAASQQVLYLSDATASLGKGLRKSIKCYKNEAKDLARSINECLDVDDALKTIHEVIYPEEHALRKSSIVHTPIDWSKYPPSAFRKFSHEQSATIREESEDELDENVDYEEKDGVSATIHKSNPSYINLNHSTTSRNNHLDSIDEKRSLFCNTDVNKRTKSLDSPQVVEPKTTSSKRRAQSVSSYPIDIPTKTNIVKKNSLQVNSIKTIRDYRCPSPRPSRKEISKEFISPDDHKPIHEEVRQQLDKAKDDDIVQKSLQVQSIKTSKDLRCLSPRPSRNEISRDSTLSNDQKTVNEEARQQIDKSNDNDDIQKNSLQGPSPRLSRKETRKDPTLPDYHKTRKEEERKQLDNTKDDGEVKRNSLQVKSIKTSKRNRCPSPRPSRREIKKDSALSDDHETANGEMRLQLDNEFDEADVQKDILPVESIKISIGYRFPSPRHFRREIGIDSSTSDDHNEVNEDEEQQLDKTKDDSDVQRISLQVESSMTTRVLRCLSPRPSKKEIIKNSSPSYNDEIANDEVRYQLDKAKYDSDVQKNSLQVNCSKSSRDHRCPSPRPSRREMRKSKNLFDDQNNKPTGKEVR